MERRDVLKSASALAAASTVGMAGCSGILGGGCDTPGENLEDSFPEGDDYSQQGEPTTDDGEGQENTERSATGLYRGPDDEEFIFSIVEFSSEDTATSELDNATESGQTPEEGAFGYLQNGAYVFVATGPDEDSVTEFMKASPTLSDGCVDDNIEFF